MEKEDGHRYLTGFTYSGLVRLSFWEKQRLFHKNININQTQIKQETVFAAEGTSV